MTEDELRKKGNAYLDKCTKRAGFVMLPEQLRNDFVDMYVAGALDNVNEWHYPSKGDYPKCGEFDATSNLVLVFWWSVDSKGKTAKVYGLDRWCEQHKEWDNYHSRPIAWMPLPLPPKESEK